MEAIMEWHRIENPVRTGKEDIKQFQYQAGGIMATTIKIDYALCEGCKMCYEVCPTDVFGLDDANRLPTVDYPEECWYCGACILDCPAEGALHLELPMPCL
jgi:NAD-dependent dihydropyrimidine dehydrogenase PreA subunit